MKELTFEQLKSTSLYRGKLLLVHINTIKPFPSEGIEVGFFYSIDFKDGVAEHFVICRNKFDKGGEIADLKYIKPSSITKIEIL